MSYTPTAVEKKILHNTKKAIEHYNMIQDGDRIMVCVSGGKDSFGLLTILEMYRQISRDKFSIFAFTLDPYDGNKSRSVGTFRSVKTYKDVLCY